MIYTQTGYVGNVMQCHNITVTAFEWLKSYQVTKLKQKSGQNLKDIKSKQAPYFISGYIEQNENGVYIRNNDNLIRRDLIIVDYDDVTLNVDDFKQHIHSKLSQYNYMLYPSISHTVEEPRYRLVVEPSRPLTQHEYKHMLTTLGEYIGLPYDHASHTWGQLMGLPVTVSKVEDYDRVINNGVPYPIPEKIDTPKKTKAITQPIQQSVAHNGAIDIFKSYLERERENLQQRDANYLSVIMVLGKAVLTEEIDELTAYECVKLLAYGNSEWEENNADHLRKELERANGNPDAFSTSYTFMGKFKGSTNGLTKENVNGIDVLKDENGKYIKGLENYENMVRSLYILVTNLFNKRIEIVKDKKPVPITDDDKEMIRMGLYKRYHVKISHQDLKTVIHSASKYQTYHPIKNLIEKQYWDGVQRAETLFIDFLGAKDTNYNREITRKWLIGAVKRIYEEGCKFDMTLVLQGAQGIGKSTIISKLAMGFNTSIDEDITKDTIMQMIAHWIIEIEEMQLSRKTESKKVKKLLSATKDDIRVPYAISNEQYLRHNVFIGTTNEKTYLRDKTGNRRFFPLLVGVDEPSKNLFKTDNNYIKQVWAEVLTYYRQGESVLCSLETYQAMETLRENAMVTDQLEDEIREYLEIPVPSGFYTYPAHERRFYIHEMLTLGNSDRFKGYTLQLRKDITTKEILEELFKQDVLNTTGNEARRIAYVMENLKDWIPENNVFRGKVRRRGYKRCP